MRIFFCDRYAPYLRNVSVRDNKTIWAFDYNWPIGYEFDDLLICRGTFNRKADELTTCVTIKTVVELSQYAIVCGYGCIHPGGDLDADVCTRHSDDLAPRSPVMVTMLYAYEAGKREEPFLLSLALRQRSLQAY